VAEKRSRSTTAKESTCSERTVKHPQTARQRKTARPQRAAARLRSGWGWWDWNGGVYGGQYPRYV